MCRRGSRSPRNVIFWFFSTHPDDEVLYMGGVIPYYVAQGKTVQVVYMTTVTEVTAKIELHDCLWAMGVRNYPILGTADR